MEIYIASFSYPGAATGNTLGHVTLSVPVDITFDNIFTNGLISDIWIASMSDPSGQNHIGFYGVSTPHQIPMRLVVTQDGAASIFECWNWCCDTSWKAEIRNNYANLYNGATLCGSIQFATPIKSTGLNGAQLSVALSNHLTASSNINIVSPAPTAAPTKEPSMAPTMQPTTRMLINVFYRFSIPKTINSLKKTFCTQY